MQLYSQQPYWLMKDGMVSSYTSLAQNISVDVAIMGAGISGALAAYHLRNSGLSIAVLERRHVGQGSTAASTSFLQYEIDKPLRELTDIVGAANAVESYRLCREAIYTIQHLCSSLKPEFDFHMRPSLQYASYEKDRSGLYKEYLLRRKNGFDVSWLEPGELKDKFGITAPGGILSADGGEVDAYLLTHALLHAVHKRGLHIYTNSNIATVNFHDKHTLLTTDRGYTIRANKLIIACGYESMKYLPNKVADIHSTYAIVSEPVQKKQFWHRDSLVWETANPYLYFRKVDGDRILIGGKDDEHHQPHLLPSLIKKKARLLEQAFNRRMTQISVKADYCWGGAFAVTKDGLPYIGSVPELKNTWFALGFGGNGITFSVIAAEIIKDLLTGKKNKSAAIFSFNR